VWPSGVRLVSFWWHHLFFSGPNFFGLFPCPMFVFRGLSPLAAVWHWFYLVGMVVFRSLTVFGFGVQVWVSFCVLLFSVAAVFFQCGNTEADAGIRGDGEQIFVAQARQRRNCYA